MDGVSDPMATDRELAERLAAVPALRRLADELEGAAVTEALAEGWSWLEIGQALGVSKQAVHKKHAKRLKGR